MSDLLTLLPPNATPLELALEKVITTPLVIPVQVDTNWDAQTCPTEVLPFLAWGWSIDFWRTDWSEARKRDLTTVAPELHRYKGTKHGVRRTLQALGFDQVQVRAWHEYVGGPGVPFSFRVDVEVSEIGINESEFDTVVRAVETATSARDTLDRLRLVLTARQTPQAVSSLGSGETITILPFQPDDVFSASGPEALTGMVYGETIYLEAA